MKVLKKDLKGLGASCTESVLLHVILRQEKLLAINDLKLKI